MKEIALLRVKVEGQMNIEEMADILNANENKYTRIRRAGIVFYEFHAGDHAGKVFVEDCDIGTYTVLGATQE